MIANIQKNWAQYPNFKNKLTYDQLMKLEVAELKEMIETLKINVKMDIAAIKI